MQFDAIPDASSSLEQTSKQTGQSILHDVLEEVKVNDMNVGHIKRTSNATIETDQCLVADKIE